MLAGAARAPVHPLWAQGIVFLARRQKDPLDLDARRLVFEAVSSYPGLHLSEIARRVDMDTNHTKYHLEVLERHDLVSSRQEDGYWRFYPKVEGDLGPREVLAPEEKEMLSLLRRRVPLHVALLLLDRDEAPLSELADEADVALSTLHYHAGNMAEAGVVESRKEGRERLYRLRDPELVAELLVRFEPPDELVKGFLEAWEEIDFP